MVYTTRENRVQRSRVLFILLLELLLGFAGNLDSDFIKKCFFLVFICIKINPSATAMLTANVHITYIYFGIVSKTLNISDARHFI